MVERHLRIPTGVWAWQGTLLVVTVLAMPPLVALWLRPEARTFRDATAIIGLASFPAILAAAIMIYFAWRLTFDHGLAWLSAAFTAVAIKGLSLAGLRAAYGSVLRDDAAALLFVDLLFAATLVIMLLLWRRTPPPFDPVVLGFGLGLLVAVLRIGLLQGEHVVIAPALLITGLGVLAMLYVGVAIPLARLLAETPWARSRIIVAVLLLGCNRIISYSALDHPVPGTLALVTDGLGAALLCTTALGLLRSSIRDNTTTVSALHQQVEQFEARNRLDRERLHEMNTTIAGIATATQLMHDGSAIAGERRSKLERMVEAEIARLAGMIGPGKSLIGPVNLDDALEPVVMAQRVLGRSVDWTPSGHQVVGRREDISEIVTTLLENAAQHAPGSPVWIGARDVGTAVELTVSDVGPGIPPDATSRLFRWGERGPSSNGQGIGLCVARRLAEGLGGTLTVVPTNGCGATFAVRLQPARTAHGAGARA